MKLLSKLLDFLIPPACSICNQAVDETATLCPDCFGEIKFITPPYCKICGRPFEFDIMGECVCAECLKKRPLFLQARSAVQYNDMSKKILLPFKHADRLDLVPLMVKLMRRAADELMPDADVIIPVPLHWSRRLKRQYNQSALLVGKLAKLYHKTFSPCVLKRTRATPSQGHLSPDERKRNVTGAFVVAKPELVAGKRVLLVDDVLTTGATANECTKVLLKAGATQVCLLTFASTIRK